MQASDSQNKGYKLFNFNSDVLSYFFLRKSNLEDKEAVEKNVLSLYKDCESFILSNECTQNLRNELEESIPDCLTVLRKWINDLENSDHGIVIAGSTICGNKNEKGIMYSL